MIRYLLDTDILSLFQQNNGVVLSRVETAARAGHQVGLSVASVEEQFSGWMKELNAARTDATFAQFSLSLADAVLLWGQFPLAPETESSRGILRQLVKAKLNVGKNDLRIASVVLDLGAILVTRNAVDYRRIPGVKFEDWAAPPPSS